MLVASDAEAKERFMEAYREEKRTAKGVYIKAKKKVNEQFGWKMNENMNINKTLFWKEVSNAKGGKVQSCSRMKDGNGRLAQGEDEVQKIWRKYFENWYNIDLQEHVAIHMCGFDGICRGNYLG